MKPVRLTDDVMIVGGGPYTGFGVSAELDAHCYLLDGGDEFALIDCGTGSDAAMSRVFANIVGAGIEPERISRLLLTHYHTDHAAGAARFRKRLGLAVGMSAAGAAALEMGDREATSFAPGQRTGLFPPDYVYPPCEVDDRFNDGDELVLGRLRIRFLATPGHCNGHGSFLVTGGQIDYLLAGDAVFASGRVSVLATHDCDLQGILASIRRLADVEFDALLPGHAAIVLNGGKDHVAKAKAMIDNLNVPLNWFA